MKHFVRSLLFVAGMFIAVPQGMADMAAAPARLELSKHVQDGLIAAEPVRGPAVDREMFNGKPVLVVFFASW